MSFKVFGHRSFLQNPRRCSRGSPRSSRRRRRRYVILEKAIGLSFLVRLGDHPQWINLTKDSRRTRRTRQLHPLPRDDSNSRYRLCFARLVRASPSPGPSRTERIKWQRAFALHALANAKAEYENFFRNSHSAHIGGGNHNCKIKVRFK